MDSPTSTTGISDSSFSLGSKETAREVTKLTTSDNSEHEVIDMGHGDVDLQMLQNTGQYEFAGPGSMIKLDRDERGVEDMKNTFKILYASVIDGPVHFESPVYISALRISTAYDFPKLRNYAMQELEKANLSAIKRIQIAREFGLTSWEVPAYSELSKRETALTEEEAQILGFSAFAIIARAREEESLKRGKVLGKQELKDEIKHGHERVRRRRDQERVKKMVEKAKMKA
ncbi:BTB/POZ domain [Rhizoctonia solani]|uniref:BTB/POZ domain n=1 Tax=Rhizoctonia solani TaxID=456999 RepID=A0A8H7IN92_9AGAM|nr:BTB/POZ domain [Rhizoctonia solani]